jgi:hypothetical protein
MCKALDSFMAKIKEKLGGKKDTTPPQKEAAPTAETATPTT